MDLDLKCPHCRDGVGRPKRVSTDPRRPFVTVALTCETCAHFWTVEFFSPSAAHAAEDLAEPDARR